MDKKNEGSYEKSKDYVVENILKDKIENGKKKFLVKFNKWVEEEDLSCPDLILEFESRKRSQLKRKMEETDEQSPSSKRRKNQEAFVDATVAQELFEMKAKLNNIENLLNNLTNDLKMMNQNKVASSAIPPPPPPMQGFVQPKKLQAIKNTKYDGVLNEMNELFKRGPVVLKKVEKDMMNEPLGQPKKTKKLKRVEEFQTLKLKKTPQLPVSKKLKK